MDQALTVWVRHQPQHVIIAVAGEIDIVTAPHFNDRLAALTANGRPLIVDLDPVSFIDVAGLRVLVGAAKRAASHGGACASCQASTKSGGCSRSPAWTGTYRWRGQWPRPSPDCLGLGLADR
jgi:anti-sigma B factor antagonist